MDILQDPANIIFFSQVSLFEISIKQRIGKLPNLHVAIEDIYEQAVNDGFTFISIQNQHIYNYSKIPLFENHRDPFDRLLIATVFHENAIVLSVDEKFKLYKDLIRVFW